ncbi:UDP-xylose and UDP-N-acetylglucosamine transporter [Microtus ochrogaster]|uniref:UDP-xylose and UDP-N-acetylglucosamine transporter n=1 Tax=Microtus ochrogaster TaxID=79684 RepID=A0A8J6KZ69_MICOH|nr:UDP-xylose and UDP-N-acetylglucosamine transporter [Microtus ochrogaster]
MPIPQPHNAGQSDMIGRKHPGCGNIVTFAQFLFIAVEGFVFEADLGRKPPAIPLRYYAIMVTMFFTVSVMNNYALNLNIAMPLHMIFRSVSASSHVCPLKSMVRWADRAWNRNSQSYRKSSLGHNDRLALRL